MGGIFLNELPSLVTDLALILMLAGLTTLLCKKLKQPLVLGYILAGFLCGPVVDFLPTIADQENIKLWSEIGVIFLMFAVGLEFSIHKLVKVGLAGILASLFEVVGMMVLGIGLGQALGWSMMNSVFLGGMLAISSTMIAIKALEDSGLKEHKFAGYAIGTLIIEDIVAIFLMIILTTVSQSQGVGGAVVDFGHLSAAYLFEQGTQFAERRNVAGDFPRHLFWDGLDSLCSGLFLGFGCLFGRLHFGGHRARGAH